MPASEAHEPPQEAASAKEPGEDHSSDKQSEVGSPGERRSLPGSQQTAEIALLDKIESPTRGGSLATVETADRPPVRSCSSADLQTASLGSLSSQIADVASAPASGSVTVQQASPQAMSESAGNRPLPLPDEPDERFQPAAAADDLQATLDRNLHGGPDAVEPIFAPALNFHPQGIAGMGMAVLSALGGRPQHGTAESQASSVASAGQGAGSLPIEDAKPTSAGNLGDSLADTDKPAEEVDRESALPQGQSLIGALPYSDKIVDQMPSLHASPEEGRDPEAETTVSKDAGEHYLDRQSAAVDHAEGAGSTLSSDGARSQDAGAVEGTDAALGVAVLEGKFANLPQEIPAAAMSALVTEGKTNPSSPGGLPGQETLLVGAVEAEQPESHTATGNSLQMLLQAKILECFHISANG